MSWASKCRTTINAASVLLVVILASSSRVVAVEPAVPSSVDVYWKSTRTIVAPGVSTVVVLDDEIAHAEPGNDTIEFAGLVRGDTVALAYINGVPNSIIVHVIERPVMVIPPSLLRRQAEMAHGVVGSDFQASFGTASNVVVLNNFSWSQQTGDHAMTFNSQVEDNDQFGGHTANLRTGGLMYRSPGLTLNVVDFSQSLTGATGEDRINNFASNSYVELRGAGMTLDRGRNEVSIFAGSTVPYYFLSLNATRDVAGLTIRRKQTDRLKLYGGSSYVNIPLSLSNGIRRRNYAMQTAGASYRLGKAFLIGGEGGISSDGGKLLRADTSFSSYRFSGYGSAVYASQTFPLNQLQSLFSGTSAFKAGTTYKLTSRLTQLMYAEHTNISPGLIYKVPGSSDYLSPSLAITLSHGEALGLTYVYSRSTGGFTPSTSSASRYDLSLSSQLTSRISNNAQVTVGSVQDPLQIASADQFSARDSLTLPIKGQILLLGVEHDRVQPSLLAKLSQEINLLSPALQAEFLANPSGFVDSANFPPEVKALLAAEQPAGTTLSASTILSLGSKLRFSPNVSVSHSSNGVLANNWTQQFGYTLSYQLRPTFQFRSSLNNTLLWDVQRNSTQRATLLAFGFQKTFLAAPGVLPWMHRGRIIEGRVFRDNNINGTYNAGEPGLPGVQVRLEDGQVAVTDEQGRYKFPSVSADEHQVSIALTQFRQPMRMTTRGEADADLIQQRIAILNFGILDFARVMGNVYNDLRFDNRRQPDSRGMQDIELLLDNGKEVRKLQTSGSGDFELDNVPPGDYKLSLDPASIPSNYLAPIETVSIHVSPVSTVVQDVPMRALRSISGNVLLKVMNPNGSQQSTRTKSSHEKLNPAKTNTANINDSQGFTLVPVAGVQIAAGPATATTDGDGRFLLRNLPAGELSVTIKPVNPVPSGVSIPKGSVKLPPEPIQIQGATIVISNADLLPYITNGSRDTTQYRALHAKPEVAVPNPSTPTTTSSSTTRQPEVVPSVALSTTGAIVQPPLPKVAPFPTDARSSATSSLTREYCEKLPSLGEVAQCLRQLKLNTEGTSAH